MGTQPVDRGWAWLVLIGCFMNTFFVVGGMKSIGIMLVQIEEYFGASAAVAGWMIGLQYFGLSIVCVGNGFLFTPSLIMVNKYFDRYRSTAMGFVMAGGSVGQLVIPILLQYLLDELSFYGCCLIYSGITLNALVAATLLRPPSFYELATKMRQKQNINMNGVGQESGKCYIREENGNIQWQNNVGKTSDFMNENQKADGKDVSSPAKNLEKIHDTSDQRKQNTNNSVPLVTLHRYRENKDELRENGDNRSENGDSFVKCTEKWNCHRICHPFIIMFDKAVTGKCVFWVYNVAVCLANAGYLCQFFMIPSYGKEIGISKQEVAWILAISGLVDLVARIIGGIFDNLRIIRTGIIISVSLSITSITVSTCLFFPGFKGLLAHSVMLGFFGGMYISLYPVALVEFLGLDLFPKAFALIVMSMGFVILPLPNLFGEIFDIFGSYLPTMWICIVAMVIGGILVAFEPMAKKIDDKRHNINGSTTEITEETEKDAV
ncbi:hypothetical protein LSH36_193g08042 [Paralvinella palmiformis]|uniref:Uncharacterized protein n=1 Tax=Paralvinella palmiformis TaxID=53620 RepID=A0AAD9JRM9_9ANNE|nr:hypothetical protein LSH36_193g08042 [Paralvinella palmiformis]